MARCPSCNDTCGAEASIEYRVAEQASSFDPA